MFENLSKLLKIPVLKTIKKASQGNQSSARLAFYQSFSISRIHTIALRSTAATRLFIIVIHPH